MKKLELVGIVMAVVAVICAIVNGGADMIGTIAFAPVMAIAGLQYAPYKSKWWRCARTFTLLASIFGGLLVVFTLGMLAALLHDVLPTHMLVGYTAAALCGIFISFGLLEGNQEILHTGVYRHAHRYAHPHARS